MIKNFDDPPDTSNKQLLHDITVAGALSIFIADDNEINRLLLETQLSPYCKNITLAEDGKIALKYLQDNKYDLILLDIQMPFLSGIQLIHMIKQPGSINACTPCIAVTAFAQHYQRKHLIQAGFDECLIKPVLLDSLQEVLQLWLPKDSLVCSKDYKVSFDYANILLEKTCQNFDLTITIFNKLFIEIKEQTLAIEQALQSNDFRLAKEIVHKLHGSVSFCDFKDLAEVTKQVEISLCNKNRARTFTYFSELKNKTSEFLGQKNQILAQLENYQKEINSGKIDPTN